MGQQIDRCEEDMWVWDSRKIGVKKTGVGVGQYVPMCTLAIKLATVDEIHTGHSTQTQMECISEEMLDSYSQYHNTAVHRTHSLLTYLHNIMDSHLIS